jgi:hypothetical protein
MHSSLILLKGMTVATDSVSIAISEATRYLDEMGASALFTQDELEKIIKASFVSLRASEADKDVLQKGILAIINRAAVRVVEGTSVDAL